MKRLLYILILIIGCKDVYNPTLKNTVTNYLVVEGNIVAGNDSTIIHLSRTIPVADTSTSQPELSASVKVESKSGSTYQLLDNNNGDYVSAPFNINPNNTYRLHIFTADGKEYASDFVPVEQTPPIDSVSWEFNETGGINIAVNTHDATNNTQYYRWQYTSTWEHRAIDSSVLIYENGALRSRRPDEQIYRCWDVISPGDILIGSTANLSSSIVSNYQLINYAYESTEFRWVYSINVTQYALTKEGFEYWGNLKKNTESLGSIFDPQPFANYGNIHCITNPQEPVLGFTSACLVFQKRIYIYYVQVHYPYSFPECKTIVVSPNNINETFLQSYLYLPLDYTDFGNVVGDLTECLDCLLQGGTTTKPPYMP